MKCFPFAALVGQEQLKKALMVCAVNPAVGGVLIRGDKGTAKSTAARGLVDIMPTMRRRQHCQFNCVPENALDICEVCHSKGADQSTIEAQLPPPFVTLPLGATEDRVIGSLNFERALKDGKKAFQPGLMANAHRGILYIDEVNLLPDHLVDVLLDTAAMGVNSVEREGLSITHPARFSLIGTMNLEEGELRPQLLDRFGMMVEIEAPTESRIRAEVVRRRISFEASPEQFEERWQGEQDALRAEIRAAIDLLDEVVVDDDLLQFISQLCCEFDARTLRADIVIHKVARTLAALAGKRKVDLQDISFAAALALPHRLRKKPTDQARMDRNKLEALVNQANEQKTAERQNESGESSFQSAPLTDSIDASGGPENVLAEAGDNRAAGGSERIFQAQDPGNNLAIQLKSSKEVFVQGNRALAIGQRRGRYLQAIPNESPNNLAVEATMRHSLIRNGGTLQVSKLDFHEKVQLSKSAGLILFVVDASGSMAALKQMELVKGTVISLLADVYQRRDQVGVISFRGTQASMLLAPTRSVDIAHSQLAELPTGGRTPLAHALRLAHEVIDANARKKGPEALMILLSDGKCNVPIRDGGDAWQDCLSAASDLVKDGVSTLVIDTEFGYLKFGKASELANVLSCQCLKLESLSVQSLTIKIGEQLKGKRRRS